jgi:hypothetical protein
MGAVFAMKTDASDYTLVHSFSLPPGDGAQPKGTLISDGTRLYGTTSVGGANASGVIFSYALPTPTPTQIPVIDLLPNKTTFSSTDRIEVNANVQTISTLCYPFVRFLMPTGQTLYYELGRGFRNSPTPYLGFQTGPVIVPVAISGYPVLNAGFTGLPAGTYYLEGGAVDATQTTSASNLVYVDGVDSNMLAVQ